MNLDTTLGDLIAALYEAYLEAYGDEEVASLAVAATIQEMLADEAQARDVVAA